jgi:predicted ATPase
MRTTIRVVHFSHTRYQLESLLSDLQNPYADALDGLELDDPVAAFFNFCREREHIRILRESGSPAPWSKDPIFQQGRFLNVFREDDRGSRAILRFAEPLSEDLPRLIHALFFARWCNSQSTLDALSPDMLTEPEKLRSTLETLPDQPWCNVTAYPVEPIRWEGTLYSRLESAIVLFDKTLDFLVQSILGSGGDVIKATSTINAQFAMKNEFPVFMAVMDLAWFRPEVIHPESHVPTGIGAVAFLDRLQKHLVLEHHQQTCEQMITLQPDYWPEARRCFHPIDIEYLSCECRKYYSYVNGTKLFEGKNLFQAGKSPLLTFDINLLRPMTGIEKTQILVLAGGPCSGKTTLLRALQKRGYRVEVETAERLLGDGVAAGHSAETLRVDPVQWQEKLLQEDYGLFEGLPADEYIFTDTSFIETLVFSLRSGLSVGPNIESWLRSRRYKQVFFLDPLEGYEKSEVRLESHKMATEISDQVRACYEHYGYKPINVPALSVLERVAFIEKLMDS